MESPSVVNTWHRTGPRAMEHLWELPALREDTHLGGRQMFGVLALPLGGLVKLLSISYMISKMAS